MSKLIDAKLQIIQRALKSYSSIQAVYIYGSYLHSPKPDDLDMYVVLAESENVLETCDAVCRDLRSHLVNSKLDINICIDPVHEFTRPDLLPYHIYIAQTGVLAYGDDILSPFRVTSLPMRAVHTRVASTANRIRHIYFNSLDDRHKKWSKWLIYGMADAELAHTGIVDVDLRVTAKRFYSRYPDQLAFLAPVFTDQDLPLDWYVPAYHILYGHLKILDEGREDHMILSEHESI